MSLSKIFERACRNSKSWYVQFLTVPRRNFPTFIKKTIFGKYLIITNTLTSGGLMIAGDVMQQEIEYRGHMLEERYDWERISRMFIVGVLLGPMYHYFYKYLDIYFPVRNLVSISKKVVLDQLLMSPACLMVFFCGLGLMEGKKMSECIDEFNRKFLQVYAIDCSVWPPTQFINFYYLPVKYQVLYINFVTMLYNVFLSYMKHKESAQEMRNIWESEKSVTSSIENIVIMV